MAKIKKYPIIGGPLDGEHANYDDFSPGYLDTYSRRMDRPHLIHDVPAGKFAEHRAEYAAFNNASGRHNDWASMVWLHTSMLSSSIRVPQ